MAAQPALRTGKTIQLWPEQLTENPANHRFIYGDLTALANSIVAHGIIQPLMVKKTKEKTDDGYPKYLVIVGNRRARASKKAADRIEAGDFVPAIVVPDDWTMKQCIAASIVTDYHSKNRNMLEIAYDLKVLVEGGQKQNALAKELGISAQYVTDALYLINTATDTIIDQVRKEVITPYQAIDMLRNAPADEVEEIVITAAKNKAKKQEEEQVINPDKKANTKTTLKKSELKEAAAGKPITLKDKKASTSAAETSKLQAGGATTPKEDATLARIVALKDTLKANAGVQVVPAFNALLGIIKYLKGTMTALELSAYFFEEEAEEEVAPTKKAAPAAKSAKGKEKAAAPAKSNKKDKKAAEEEGGELEEEPADLEENENWLE